jgi:hypothetical protein
MLPEQKIKGYTNLPAQERHGILTTALRHESALVLFRRLNAMVIMRKNKTDARSVTIRRKFLADRNWIKQFL